MDPFKKYIAQLQAKLDTGESTEHTHRSALEELLKSIDPSVAPINEPKRIECGAPDYIIERDGIPIGYIEAKDIDANLDHEERSDQMRRYLESLNNLILTDYLEFRWYVDGQKRLVARIEWRDPRGRLKPDKDGICDAAQLVSQFFAHEAPSVGDSKELARRMAAIARMVHDLIAETFKLEGENGPFQGQLESFREVLIADLKADQFADMYAQTITYGLFAARCNHEPSAPFKRQSAAFELPKTNPFLRKLFGEIAGPDLDERIAWAVDNLAELLSRADMYASATSAGAARGKTRWSISTRPSSPPTTLRCERAAASITPPSPWSPTLSAR